MDVPAFIVTAIIFDCSSPVASAPCAVYTFDMTDTVWLSCVRETVS